MNVTIPRGDGSKSGDLLKPGEWGVTEDGHIMIRCPHSEHSDKLPRYGIIRYAGVPNPRNWKIDEAGKVTPSVFFKDAACGWHIFATLAGWTPDLNPDTRNQ